MAKRSAQKATAHADRLKKPSAEPNETRGKYWERQQAPFDAAHIAFEASVQAQRQLVGAVAEKFGVDVKVLTRSQLEAFDAVVKVASGLPSDVPNNGQAQP